MTYRELLQRLTDLRLLAVPPLSGERSGNMSSFDRASQYDPASDTYRCWGANDDGTGCIRKLDDGTIVAFEQEGPGVIWRIWSALPEQGHIRVYIDENPVPVIDVPFIDWFEREPGEVPPLNYSELSMRLSRGRNSMIPIPYQKSCRVELAPGWGAYYQFTYTQFPEGTVMPDYSDRFTRDGRFALAETDRLLYDRGETPLPGRPVSVSRSIPAGEQVEVLSCSCSGAVSEIRMQLPCEAALKALEIELFWDGECTPSVSCPLGEFFGGAPGYARVRTLPLSMERGGLSCRFYMPFSQGMRLCLRNTGSEESYTIQMTVLLDTQVQDPEHLLRFHARHETGDSLRELGTRFAPGGDRWPDWPCLVTDGGAGRFVGLHMNIENTWPEPEKQADTWWYGQWDRKSVDWWWGEGDEKFFVDHEKFPSTFGTGSEDYIGYAWAAEPPFARFDSSFAAMNAMPVHGNGHTSVMRFQIADNVPFQNHFEAYMEKYKEDHWEHGGICTYSVIAYWYQTPENTSK